MFNLGTMTLSDKARKKIYSLKDDQGEWSYMNGFLEEKKFNPKINEILVSKKLRGQTVFELFLKCYKLDFEKMMQINDETGFSRPIRRKFINESAKDPFKWLLLIFNI